MQKRSRKKEVDLNGLAATIIEKATADQPVEETQPDDSGKNPAAVQLGRLGGLKGGKARAKNMTAAERSEAAKKAARARWKSKR